jgi:Fe-S-cluster containining protein
MKLDVLPSSEAKKPWYGDGLRFTCTQCGNCCTGGPGYVWISGEEIARVAEHLRITSEQTIERYCRKIGDRYSLKESRNVRGEHDCIFLKEECSERTEGNEVVTQSRRTCGIYAVRPLQCRTWPFWDSNLSSPEIWEMSAKRCHGMNRGRLFSQAEMEALQNADEWPSKPPTSASEE